MTETTSSYTEDQPPKPSETGTVIGIVVVSLIFWPAALIWSIVLSATHSWRRTTKITGYVVSLVTIVLFIFAIVALVGVSSGTKHALSAQEAGAGQAPAQGTQPQQNTQPSQVIQSTPTTAPTDCPIPYDRSIEQLPALTAENIQNVLVQMTAILSQGIATGNQFCLNLVEIPAGVTSDNAYGVHPGVLYDVKTIDDFQDNGNGTYAVNYTDSLNQSYAALLVKADGDWKYFQRKSTN